MALSKNELISKLAKNNPGTLAVLKKVSETKNSDEVLQKIKKMKLFPSQIWIIYKDMCRYNVEKFCDKVINSEEKIKAFLAPIENPIQVKYSWCCVGNN